MGEECPEGVEEMKVITETKITLRAGIIISLLSSLVVFILSVLWLHQTDITLLKTNQQHVLATLVKIDQIPVELAKMGVKIEALSRSLDDHKQDSRNGKKK